MYYVYVKCTGVSLVGAVSEMIQHGGLGNNKLPQHIKI